MGPLGLEASSPSQLDLSLCKASFQAKTSGKPTPAPEITRENRNNALIFDVY